MTASIHLVRNPLRPYERESQSVPAGTRIIDWLVEVAPTGFGMPIELYVNQQKVEVVDADRELHDGDVCACLVVPGEPFTWAAFWAAAQSYAIQAAVSIAIGVALSALFGPRPPKSQRGPNPVYDIGAASNQARLGEPIPVAYGNVATVPDFASVPYTFFSKSQDDQMYVDQLFSVGCGTFEEITADEILIGDTPASLFPPGVILFEQFHQGAASGNIKSHQGLFGTIENQLWSTGDFGVDEFKFFENVYTAPDVTEWEFRNDETRSTTVQNYAVDVTDLGLDVTQNRHQIRIRGPIDMNIRAGNTFSITGTTFDGQYTCISAIPDYTTGSGTPPDIDYTHILLTCWAPIGVTPAGGAATISTTVDTVSSQAQTGWYAAQPLGDTVKDIYWDLVAPRGLYKVKSNSGTRVYLPNEYAPDILVEAQEIDPTTGIQKNVTSPGTGFSLEQTFRMNGNSPDPIRWTGAFVTADVVTNPTGTASEWRDRAYVVRMTARHEFLDNDRYAQSVVWAGLKGMISKPSPLDAYGDVTLLAVRMRGTNGISEQARQRVKVRCRRVYTLQDGSTGVSGNPVDVINDIYRDPTHGFGRPADEVNSAYLAQIRSLWAAQGVEFNGVFLQDITGWDALEAALLPAVAKPAIDAGQLTIVADKKKPVTMFLFNDLSIVPDSYSGVFTIDNTDDTDGVEVEYREPGNFDPAYAREPSSSTTPQRLVYFGVTDSTYAAELARLFWNRRLYQRHVCSFQTEMQGMVPMVGDKISVSTPVLQSGVSGRVMAINDTRVVLDKRIVWGANVEISFTQPDQSPTAYYAVTEGTEPNIAILATPVVEDLDLSMLRTPASYHIRMDGYQPRDMVVTNIEHNGGQLFTVSAIDYPEDVGGVNPLFDGGPGHLVLDWDGTPL